mmetsp:Transcript_14194/g.17441  ORF Transcript_14194/g.17441 Transcript_14194/m.17441 type:complete len:213 (-) Transcript_14194:1125-1763(-)
MSIGFLGPFSPSLCYQLSSFFHKSIHGGPRQHPSQDSRSITPGEKPATRLPACVNCSNDVDDQDQTQESSYTDSNTLGMFEDKTSDFDGAFVRAVGEIVVPCTGKVMLTYHLHLYKTSIKVGRCPVQLFAVGLGVLVVGIWITCHNLVLIQIGKTIHQGLPLWIIGVCLSIKQQGLLLQGQRNGFGPRLDLNQVGSVCASTTVSCIVVIVGI